VQFFRNGAIRELLLPYIHRFSEPASVSRNAQVAIFAEVFYPVVNGVVLAVDHLCRELRALHIFVTLVTPKMTKGEPHFSDSADVEVQLPSFGLPGTSGYRGLWPRWSRSLRAELAGVRVVHAHSFFVAGMLARRAARAAGSPFIVSYHTRLDAYAHYAGPAAGFVRGWLDHHIRAFANSATLVTVPTRAIAAELRRKGVQTPVAVVPSGLDLTVFDGFGRSERLAEVLRRSPGDALILSVARLAREKNLLFLLDAFARLRHAATLLFVGDGPEREELMRHASVLGVDHRLRFLGMLGRSELGMLYRACDLFAFPSLTETQGFAISEALYTGLPVVLIDTEPAREVTEGSDASLTPPDRDAFAQAMDEMLVTASDETRRSARRATGARYDRRITTRRMTEIYQEFLLR
jgi:1,2-diacylglycerol 3-alpha-glucosyltransferase